MSGLRRLFSCIGQAVLSAGPKALMGMVPFGEAIFDVAADALKRLRQKPDAEVNAELAEAASTEASTAKQEAEAVAAVIAADQPSEVRINLASYLSMVPDAVRQSLRRPSDPTGKTVPTGMLLQKPEQLLPYLPSRLPRFKPGDRPTPGGTWELIEMLGVGGFGEVWKARHPHLDSLHAALKFCLDPRASEALRHEGVILNRIMRCGSHPGIVPLQQAQLDTDPCYLQYEYIDGGNLGKLLSRRPREAAALLTWATGLVRKLAQTVGWFHSQNPPIVHRDLKPANVLLQRILAPDQKSVSIKMRIADFGIGGLAASRALEQTRAGSTTRGELLLTSLRGSHTPHYASPQQARGEPPDVRDDVHALGVIWYQMLTGDLMSGVGPDFMTDLRELGADDKTITLLGQCVSAKAERRPQDGAALAAKLDELLANVATPSPAVSVAGPTTGPSPMPLGTVAPAATKNASEPTVTPAGSPPTDRSPVQPVAASKDAAIEPVLPVAGISNTPQAEPRQPAADVAKDDLAESDEDEDEDESEDEEEDETDEDEDEDEDAQARSLRKAAVVQEIAASTKLTGPQISQFLDAMTALIQKELGTRGPGVFTLPGLLKFRRKPTRARPSRTGKNPQTGKPMEIPAQEAGFTVRIRPLKALKDVVELDEDSPADGFTEETAAAETSPAPAEKRSRRQEKRQPIEADDGPEDEGGEDEGVGRAAAQKRVIEVKARGSWLSKPKDHPERQWRRAGKSPGTVVIEDGKIYGFRIDRRAVREDFAALAELSSLDSLKHLDLMECKHLADAGMEHLRKFTAIENLFLNASKQITDAGMACAEGLTSLVLLDVSGCKQLTDQALVHLRLLKRLKMLYLADCEQITGEGFNHLCRTVALTELVLKGCNRLTDKALGYLGTMTSLATLILADCNQITDAGVSCLRNLAGLEKLDLSGCELVSDGGLSHLRNLTALKALDLTRCGSITDIGLTQPAPFSGS